MADITQIARMTRSFAALFCRFLASLHDANLKKWLAKLNRIRSGGGFPRGVA
jgi:hypothetical protein